MTFITEAREHKPHAIVIIILTFIITVAATVFNFIFLTNEDEGVFTHSSEELRDIYPTDVLPSGTVTGVEVVVFIFQILWTIYSCTTIWRESRDGYLYYSPRYLCFYTNLIFSLGIILEVIWLFLWDSKEFIPEAVIIGVAGLFVSVATVLAYKAMMCNGRELLMQGKKSEVIATRFLVHNGLAMINTWIWFNCFMHTGLAVYLDGAMTQKDSSTLALGLIAAYILIEAIYTVVFDKYVRYVFGSYIVEIWMLVGILGLNWDPDARNSIITLMLLLIVIVFFILKIIWVIRKAFTDPEPLLHCPTTKIQDQKIDGIIQLPPFREEPKPVEVLNIIQPEPVPVHPVFPRTSRAPPPVYVEPMRPQPEPVYSCGLQQPRIEVLNEPQYRVHTYAAPAQRTRSRMPKSMRGPPMGAFSVPGDSVPQMSYMVPTVTTTSFPGTGQRSFYVESPSMPTMASSQFQPEIVDLTGGYSNPGFTIRGRNTYGGYTMDSMSNIM